MSKSSRLFSSVDSSTKRLVLVFVLNKALSTSLQLLIFSFIATIRDEGDCGLRNPLEDGRDNGLPEDGRDNGPPQDDDGREDGREDDRDLVGL